MLERFLREFYEREREVTRLAAMASLEEVLSTVGWTPVIRDAPQMRQARPLGPRTRRGKSKARQGSIQSWGHVLNVFRSCNVKTWFCIFGYTHLMIRPMRQTPGLLAKTWNELLSNAMVHN